MQACLFPGKRPKHTRVSIEDIIKKSEQDYVDFQEAAPGFKRSGGSTQHCQGKTNILLSNKQLQ